MRPCSIRVAEESDIDCLVDMGLALQAHVEDSNRDIWRLSAEGRKGLREQFARLISDPDVQVLLAFNHEGQAIGMAVGRIRRHRDHIPEISGSIDRLLVKEAYRRRGVGTELVLSLCEFFTSHKAKDIPVRYVLGNREAERFWKRLGFQVRIETAGVKRRSLLERISSERKCS